MGKIGDVEITKIPPGQPVECQSGCSAIATSFRNGIPYCVDCLLAEQEKAWNNGVSIIYGDREVIEYDDVELYAEGNMKNRPASSA